MSTFTLAISCLTTSNLPWFMDITFQVPMQYCSLQHRTLLLSPVTSTKGYCFCFGSIPSFFLELFLHWSPVAYWAPTNLGSSSVSILSFCQQIFQQYFIHILSICQKIWKTQQWPQDWKRSVFIPVPKKGNAKEFSNYPTIALISHSSKVMFKILQVRLQPEPCTSRCSSWF